LVNTVTASIKLARFWELRWRMLRSMFWPIESVSQVRRVLPCSWMNGATRYSATFWRIWVRATDVSCLTARLPEATSTRKSNPPLAPKQFRYLTK
jgi:hypothetical protein